jgi:hypothetical protein
MPGERRQNLLRWKEKNKKNIPGSHYVITGNSRPIFKMMKTKYLLLTDKAADISHQRSNFKFDGVTNCIFQV